jgi:hypothetical protein
MESPSALMMVLGLLGSTSDQLMESSSALYWLVYWLVIELVFGLVFGLVGLT